MTTPHHPAPSLIRRFLACRNGATAIEYALIASVLAGVIVAAMQTLGTGLTTVFTNIAARLNGIAF